MKVTSAHLKIIRLIYQKNKAMFRRKCDSKIWVTLFLPVLKKQNKNKNYYQKSTMQKYCRSKKWAKLSKENKIIKNCL